MKRALFVLVFCSITADAATVDNDDSCDISVLPAATLLLPYFEVDLDDPGGETTLFTVTNVTNYDQIAHVTLWTDYAYPVLSFNLYLTGYDVQAINLFDVISRGLIAPDAGTGTQVSKRGSFSDLHPARDLSACGRLPGALDPVYITRMQQAFTLGRAPGLGSLPACNQVGGLHDNAIGYATIDVIRTCSNALPTEPVYWTRDILYDNVLTGDYQQINSRENFAQGGTLVHIRAIPEGGTPAARANNPSFNPGFERTFYGRYQAAGTPRLDGRQPLPATFATRWISGGPADFATSMKVWREGRTDANTTCAGYEFEARRRTSEVVVFDEDENAVTMREISDGIFDRPELPLASRTDVTDSEIYPQLANGGTAGWMYFNLDHSRDDTFASQNWVISSMRAQGRFSTDIDSIALGNGCSAPVETTRISLPGGPAIAPAPNEAPATTGVASKNNDDSCDIALLPAATLLLPYFEVDLDNPAGETTLFTITNVTPADQIARVTLWTDAAYPVLTFNVFLTGYDVQALNLFDVLSRGIIAPPDGTGTRVTDRGDHSVRNTALDLSACATLPGTLRAEVLLRMRRAFTRGVVPATGATGACNMVGNEHVNAVGYATIDVVRSCTDNSPIDAAYWTQDLLYDNVLMGDYQQVSQIQNFAQGSPMVHIRAVPEGGTAATRSASPFPHTFYRRYQAAANRGSDGRQPLPSVFATRWIQGSTSSFQTSFKIWRAGTTGVNASCPAHVDNLGMEVPEVVRFDEAENAVAVAAHRGGIDPPLEPVHMLPATSRTSVTEQLVFPHLTNGAVAGWIYINLDNDARDSESEGTSNWVIASMRAQGRYSVDIDAAGMGNGCSRAFATSEVWKVGGEIISPAPNER